MCYNCGCELPEDPMGKGYIRNGGGSLTESDFKHMAEKWGMTKDETKNNVFNLLKQQLKK